VFLDKVFSEDFDLAADLDRALKSYVLDETISKALHSLKSHKVSSKA
jgi:hypothetical protein